MNVVFSVADLVKGTPTLPGRPTIDHLKSLWTRVLEDAGNQETARDKGLADSDLTAKEVGEILLGDPWWVWISFCEETRCALMALHWVGAAVFLGASLDRPWAGTREHVLAAYHATGTDDPDGEDIGSVEDFATSVLKECHLAWEALRASKALALN